MNFKIEKGGVTSPKGFKASGVSAGLKSADNKDLALIYSEKMCNSAGVYTQNKVKGAPVLVTMKHLSDHKSQAIVANSGNANTCTGDKGIDNAEKMCSLCAQLLDLNPDDVLVASTGVIGVQLDISAVQKAVSPLVNSLSKSGYMDASAAIMTTDTVAKTISTTFKLHEKTVTIGAMTKGSGMIHPNMATMLAFITTDANISPQLLDKALRESVKISFNRISVDRDTSTNDMALIIANGLAENPVIEKEDDDYYIFSEALSAVTIHLAKMMAKDGEGATKLVECKVTNAPDENSAEILAKSVICSNLVKTAMFGCDANWGRILDALGYAGVDFNVNKIELSIESSSGKIDVFSNGYPTDFSEDTAKSVLSEDEVLILVNMNSGSCVVSCWGCDLTYDYVKINGSYRS
ncbi:MAG: bifunctional glutamate N-acetyltransferase/amino-acid acetyltransferase ArgJ [Clostridium sp.]|jgi:glutamate N-acetyltransferase/amino-acid N-acetyltransferase|uniref:bifunctional glutamate N-acetyltransferase/amino-acid acetyltransferase ArgJ n=1 Tax=Clostridium sp. TaxID=1506 RepID=UPI0025B856B4|nr:bifunctional glutamate N-acetyltransferase/amino-acid acetyltransferase ArgJ [Clostridium sp.]MCH3963100.1 bifunctional glutamate N-acetyltransferase/amino-acid acetyltransferase ArgJ [Clostridium sp.]MCI1716437.1 bifunctional glutamate N-acetyltransferase/amino-acid acetyltransferase ArgJ [Clostridium sp.]MCI1800777.1 bifunctional glutamate N-acetyltransferase/amino-acid acetyltransferase ArgJ [Clostridium sp.]MCI1814568.1 bifunctional glutamate N-acetyltransferase/amino-acid acetyltransfer